MKLMMKSVMGIMIIVYEVYYLVPFFSKEDDYDPKEDTYSQKHDTSNEECLISDMDDDYENLFENPIFEVLCDDNPPCSAPDDEYLEI